VTASPTSKYNKFSEKKQGLSEENEKKLKIRKNHQKKEPSSEAKEPQGEAPQWHLKHFYS
jgi:hypothetical protein